MATYMHKCAVPSRETSTQAVKRSRPHNMYDDEDHVLDSLKNTKVYDQVVAGKYCYHIYHVHSYSRNLCG